MTKNKGFFFSETDIRFAKLPVKAPWTEMVSPWGFLCVSANHNYCYIRKMGVFLERPSDKPSPIQIRFTSIGGSPQSEDDRGCCLTRLRQGQMADILLATVLNSFSCLKFVVFRFKFHWRLFLRVSGKNISTLFQIMVWYQIGDKSLSKSVMANFAEAYIRHSPLMS